MKVFISICERVTRGPESERAIVKLSHTRAASHTIIDPISTKGVIHIALRKPYTLMHLLDIKTTNTLYI